MKVRRWLKGLAVTLLTLAVIFTAGGLALAPTLREPASTPPAPAIDTAAAASDRPTLILLHGAGLNAHMWDPVIRRLDGTRWRVIALDLPGHGARAGEAFTLPAAIAAVTDAARRAAPAPVVLAGDSLGGYTALAAAGHLPPGQLRGLVVAGATAEFPAHLGVGDWAPRLAFRWLFALRDENKLAPAALARFGVAPEDTQSLLAAGVRLSAVETAVDGLMGTRYEPLVRAIPQPILFLNGADDTGRRVDEAAWTKAARQGSAQQYEGAGHGISMRRPVEFARDLAAFAARVMADAGMAPGAGSAAPVAMVAPAVPAAPAASAASRP